jgi:hypothetical protein
MSHDTYTHEDDDEISLFSNDSIRSGESHEYARNAKGYTTPPHDPKPLVLPSLKNEHRAVKVVKKRRIRPTLLQAKLPVETIKQTGECLCCQSMCDFKMVTGNFYLCPQCYKYAIGVSFSHKKLRLIVELRRELEIMDLSMTRLGRDSDMPAVVDLHSRISAMHRVIAGLFYDNTDIRSM